MLCCAVLCCAVLCCAVLCCAVLCCAVLCVTMQSDGYVYHTLHHIICNRASSSRWRRGRGLDGSDGMHPSYFIACSVRWYCMYSMPICIFMPLSFTQTGLGEQSADHIVRRFEMVSRPRVYLDKVRLLDGQRFDIGFTVGLAQSTVSQTPLLPAPFPTPLPLAPSLRASVHLCFCCLHLWVWRMALSPYGTYCTCCWLHRSSRRCCPRTASSHSQRWCGRKEKRSVDGIPRTCVI